MVELEIDCVKNGTIYFKKAVKRNVEFKAIVLEVEACVDRNNRPFTAAYLQPEESKKKERWNCFDLIEAKKIKPRRRLLVTGIYFGPFKKELKTVEVIRKRRNQK